MKVADQKEYMKDEIRRMIQESDDIIWDGITEISNQISKEEALIDDNVNEIYQLYTKNKTSKDTLEQYVRSFYGM